MDMKDQLREAFGKYGEIGDVHIPRDRGFAFVRFLEERDADDAIDGMNETKFNGEVIKCVLATKPKRTAADMEGRKRGYQNYDRSRSNDRYGGDRGRGGGG